MMSDAWFWLAIIALALGSLFSTLHLSLREVSRLSLEELAAHRRSEGARHRINAILDDVDGHCNAVVLPRILCNLTVVVGMVLWVASLRGVQFATWVEQLSGILISGGAIWFFGGVIPHSLSSHVPDRIVYRWSTLLRALYVVARPLRVVSDLVDRVIERLFGRPHQTEAEALEEELLSVVHEGEKEGQIDETARDMIEAVVDFRSTTVEQIMTPRTEVDAIEATDELVAVARRVIELGHSRIPVHTGSLDQVVGILYAKDLLRWMAEREARERFEIRKILRPAVFVPETKTVRELLAELLAKRVHIAMVADEYGGTSGIVTMEDIIEEVFGEIQDEYELPEDEGPVLEVNAAEGWARVDARMRISDANDGMEGLGVEIPESEEYDTVGGFVTWRLGRIPHVGDEVRLERLVVVVLEAEPTRVESVRVQAIGEEPKAAEPPIVETPEEASAARDRGK